MYLAFMSHYGNIITAGGIISSLDLDLYLIKRLNGKEKTKAISEQIEFEQHKPIWINEGFENGRI